MAVEALDTGARLLARAGAGKARRRRMPRHWTLWVGGGILALERPG